MRILYCHWHVSNFTVTNSELKLRFKSSKFDFSKLIFNQRSLAVIIWLRFPKVRLVHSLAKLVGLAESKEVLERCRKNRQWLFDTLRTRQAFSADSSVETMRQLAWKPTIFHGIALSLQFPRVWNNGTYFCSFGRNHGDEHLAAGEIVEGRESSSSSMTKWLDDPHHSSSYNFLDPTMSAARKVTPTPVQCDREWDRSYRLATAHAQIEDPLRTSDIQCDICSVYGREITHIVNMFDDPYLIFLTWYCSGAAFF